MLKPYWQNFISLSEQLLANKHEVFEQSRKIKCNKRKKLIKQLV